MKKTVFLKYLFSFESTSLIASLLIAVENPPFSLLIASFSKFATCC